ncbi:hypothetical protein EH183_41720 [Streptomyces sp. CB01881]|uniref:hypothetical protein n=1 Tax=Streptomyces sp. CB01881 TaxID=2078691 RepID=UPI0011DFA9AD|nr:hypothetical protein [Streptomyces sp. CB01881]TYC66727.1 hypothetical protein EH183_41720 [Streptomyces sp. CB01881]
MPSIILDAERRVGVDSAHVRAAAADVLRRQGFRLTSEWATVVEAHRGSAVRSVLMVPDEVPVAVRIDLAAEAGGCVLALRVTDRAVSMVVVGVQEPYRVAFQALLAELDRALGELDPQAAATGFREPRWWFRGRNVEAIERGHAVGQRLVGNAAALISGRLAGGPQSAAPAEWGGYEHVVFASSAGAAVLDMGSVRALLTIPVMISARPGALPPQLASQVQEFAATVEVRLGAGGRGGLLIDVPEEHRKTFEFLHQQFGIRSRLPVRTLCVCSDCLQPKVVNLDLQRLRRRNRNLKTLASLVTLSGHGEPNAFTVFGTVFRQAKLEPDFVCGRCESTDADEQPVTFCPKCGEMCKDSVLLTCAKCRYDYRDPVKGVAIWEAAPTAPPMPLSKPTPVVPPVPPARPALPPPMPATSPATERAVGQFGPPPPAWAPPAVPRRSCGICGRSYPTLWQVQVAEGAAARTLTVCATSPRCSPPSLVAPVRIAP